MKIDIPFEIGDPVLVIEYNQHDGYYMRNLGIKLKCIFGETRDMTDDEQNRYNNILKSDEKTGIRLF